MRRIAAKSPYWSPFLSLSRLFPHLSGLRVERILIEGSRIILHLRVARQFARCPLCRRRSERRHSRYFRTLADLPVASRAVQLRVAVRRFRCVNPFCRRRVFAERLPQLAADYARRTREQRAALADLGFALGGSAGVRLGGRLKLVGSRATILRLVHATPTPPFPTPRVLGVDDWAKKRGQVYGTILVDLERRRPIDLLPDRNGASFARWLAAHPGVEIIARDRGGAYADGARQGAPTAVQVADRFHLLANVGDTLERLLGRKHLRLAEAAREVDRILSAEEAAPVAAEGAPPAPAPTRWSKREIADRQARRARRLARYEAVVALRQQGATLAEIMRRVGLSRHTVQRFLAADVFPERARPRRRPSMIAQYEPYLRRRWGEGCQNSMQLWRELQAQGFAGAASLVRRHVANWRTGPARRGLSASRGSAAGALSAPRRSPTRVLSPRQARWLLMRPAERLTDEERLYRAALLESDEDVKVAYTMAEEFGELVRARDRQELGPWLGRAVASTLAEFRQFALVLQRDLAAVEAALTYEWSNGQTEGQITKLKLLKRQMFGRASFDLLKKRELKAA